MSPEHARALLERDYAAPDFQVASLKFLDRLRTAYARASESGHAVRIPLRRLVHPLRAHEVRGRISRPTAHERIDRRDAVRDAERHRLHGRESTAGHVGGRC